MRNLLIAASSLAALGLAGAASAAPVLLDFEGETAGTIIDDEYAPLVTVTTNSNGSNNHAVIFDTDNPTGNDADLGAPFDNPFTGPAETFEPGNVLIISEDARGITCDGTTCSTPDDEGQGGTIEFAFSEVVTVLGFDVFDITDASASFSVDFFNSIDALFFTVIFSDGIGDNEFDAYSSVIEGVSRMVFNFGGSGAIDNLLFETSEIPVPGALPLLLSGIAGLGFASRKRKKA